MKFRYRKPVALVAGFAIALAVVLVALGWRRSASEGPTYEGRSLSVWLSYIDAYSWRIPDRNSPLFLQTSNAIVQIGTNGLPWLVEWIRYKPSRVTTAFWSLQDSAIGRLPSTNLVDSIGRWSRRGFDRAGGAVVAFEILGPSAASCVTELSSIANDSGNPAAAQRATYALAKLGPAAIPALLEIASNTNALTRRFAIYILGGSGTNAVSAIPMLIRTLAGPDTPCARSAARALGKLTVKSETAVPALVIALQHRDYSVRGSAASSLAAFGTNAAQAVPALHIVLSDRDPIVREAASNALQVINSAPAVEATAR